MRQEGSESFRKFITHFQRKFSKLKTKNPQLHKQQSPKGSKLSSYKNQKTLPKLLELVNSHVNAKEYNEVTQPPSIS